MILLLYALISYIRHLAATFHSKFIAPCFLFYTDTVLRTYEDIVKSTIRQGFIELERSLSALSTWTLSLLNGRNYRKHLRRTWDHSDSAAASHPSSTLNSILAAWNGASSTHSDTVPEESQKHRNMEQAAQDELFQQPSGAGVISGRQRGLIEDARIIAGKGLTVLFSLVLE